MTLQIVLAAAVNVGVVTGAAPTKGLALPFLSYGGSSLIASVATVGFILSVGVRGPAPERPVRESPPPPSHRPSTDLWNG